MVKIIVGLMGASAASGSSKLSSPDQLRPLLAMLQRHDIHELDTARAYNSGRSEEHLGALPEARANFTIATKAPGFSPGSLTRANILAHAEASLAALQQPRLDLYYFHGPDRRTPLEESCSAIDTLHRAGRIAAFGVSNLTAAEVAETHALCTARGWVAPSVYQGGFNALGRAAEAELLPLLRRLGIAFYAYSPLAGGFFARPAAELRAPPPGARMDVMKHFAGIYVTETSLRLHDELSAVCAREGVAVKAAALRWLRHHSVLGEQDGVVLGGSSVEQLEENIRACEEGPLPESVVEVLEGLWEKFTADGHLVAYGV